MGSQVGGQFSCQWRCKETPGDEEEAELAWQLIKCGKPEQGRYRWCLIERETVTESKGGIFWLYGQSPAEQGHTQSSFCVFASLIDQVREKKDVPLGPEDPKEEDGSFDYRCVISLAPVHTVHPIGWVVLTAPEVAPFPQSSSIWLRGHCIDVLPIVHRAVISACLPAPARPDCAGQGCPHPRSLTHTHSVRGISPFICTTQIY